MPQARDEAGNIWEVDAQGNAVRLIRSANEPPADPEYPHKGPKIEAEVESTRTNTRRTQADAVVTESTAPTTIQTNQAPAGHMWVDPRDPTKGVVPIPGYDPNSGNDEKLDKQKLGNMRALANLLDDLDGLYYQGPGSTSGVAGVADYFPTVINNRFNTKAASLGDVGFAAFRVPGSGTQTDADQQRFIEANTPKAGDRDEKIREKLANVRNRLNETARAFGIEPQELTAPPPNAMTDIRTDGGVNGSQRQAAGFDATTATVDYPKAGQEEHDTLVARLAAENNGRIPPEAYANARAALDQKYGVQGNTADSYMTWATSVNDYLDAGGRTIPTGIMPTERVMTQTETLRNKLVSNPVGAGAVSLANAAGWGAVDAFAPEQAAALDDAYPLSSLAGEVGGSIVGTGSIGSIGRNTVGRAFPKMLGETAPTFVSRYVPTNTAGQFGRNLAADATYGAVYGHNSEGDALTGAAFGAGGSTAGQAFGKALGTLTGGVTRSAPVQALRDRKIPMTVGQQLGGWAKAAEDKLTSVPIIGDIVNDRRLEGLRAFNQEAFREAGAPIGHTPSAIGREGVTELLGDRVAGTQGAVGRAYDDAVGGLTLHPDDVFDKRIDAALDASKKLTPDYAEKAEFIFNNRLEPFRGDTYYHGTDAVLDGPLRASEGGMLGPALYVTKRPDVAGHYGSTILPVRARTDKLASLEERNAVLNEMGPPGTGYDAQQAKYREAAEILKRRGYIGIDANEHQHMAALFDPANTRPATGREYQGVRSDLKGFRAEERGPGFAEKYGEVLTQGIDALDDLVRRQGGEEVVQNLGKADQSYRLGRIVQDATERAKGGSGSGEVRVFTPSQLQMSSQASTRKFPGANPLDQLADDGQAVLPSRIPDSGTGGRLMQMALPGALVGGGAVSDTFGADGLDSGLYGSGAIAAAIALLGTRKGQQALSTMIFERPDAMRRAGQSINRRRGLFGSSGAGLALQGQ